MKISAKDKLKKLADFLIKNKMTIIKSAPSNSTETHSNKICVSIYNGGGDFTDYVFEEEITPFQITTEDYQ